ncbi:MAG: succinate dehydrogenase assembly factor 2 [Pseudomonadota bacterium]
MSKLRWQCRRGMAELDQLLTRYLTAHYESAAENQKAAFQAFLQLSDPELNAYLLQGVEPPTEYHALVERLLDRTAS